MRRVSEEERVERSIPVQGRVDLTTLAKIDSYFQMNGEVIGSMSQLIRWGMELLVEALEKNELLQPDTFESLAEANRYLLQRGLYQPGTRKKSRKKLAMAMSFESLRDEGVNPKHYVKHQYNVLHNERSVRQPGELIYDYDNSESGGRSLARPEDVRIAKKLIEEARKRKEEQENYDPIQAAKAAGINVVEDAEHGVRDKIERNVETKSSVHEGMTEEEAIEHIRKADAERVALENAPFKMSDFKVVSDGK